MRKKWNLSPSENFVQSSLLSSEGARWWYFSYFCLIFPLFTFLLQLCVSDTFLQWWLAEWYHENKSELQGYKKLCTNIRPYVLCCKVSVKESFLPSFFCRQLKWNESTRTVCLLLKHRHLQMTLLHFCWVLEYSAVWTCTIVHMKNLDFTGHMHKTWQLFYKQN